MDLNELPSSLKRWVVREETSDHVQVAGRKDQRKSFLILILILEPHAKPGMPTDNARNANPPALSPLRIVGCRCGILSGTRKYPTLAIRFPLGQSAVDGSGGGGGYRWSSRWTRKR